jgi:RNA 3'-terminal phosphate cyclase
VLVYPRLKLFAIAVFEHMYRKYALLCVAVVILLAFRSVLMFLFFLKIMEKTITLRGSAGFRQRIVFATLSGRAVRIKDIRTEETTPGLAKHEVSFLRLIEKLTTGGLFEISVTGTSVYYKPGALVGGKFSHDCGVGRCVTWFLEGVLPLLPFAMSPITLILSGITNSGRDQSVDLFRTVMLPLVMRFGLEEGLEFKILARGAPPEGGGQVMLFVPTVRKLKPVRLFEQSKARSQNFFGRFFCFWFHLLKTGEASARHCVCDESGSTDEQSFG